MKRNLLLILILVPSTILAQKIDSAFIGKGVLYAQDVHARRVKGESPLYNGMDFNDYKPIHEEYPYFLSNDWMNGSIYYEGQLYDNIYLQYNSVTDEVIIENHNFSSKIQLVKTKIKYFTLENHYFTQVDHPSLSPGFYELLYSGQSKVIAKRLKRTLEQTSSTEFLREFLDKPKYFIYKDNQYSQVSNKHSVLALFKDRKQELRKQFHDKGIKFRSNPEKGIIVFAELYDHLSQ